VDRGNPRKESIFYYTIKRRKIQMAQLIFGLLSIFIILLCSVLCILGLCNFKNWNDDDFKVFLLGFAFTVLNSVLLATGHLL
jgi:ABC-type transport system involved in multi-copper enzyme maturation permease subunit